MPSDFNPYYFFLGIPLKDQPADYYRLLGLERLEDNAEIIAMAADRQMGYLQRYESGEHADHVTKLMSEVSRARLCLLNLKKKAEYDRRLESAQPENADRANGDESLSAISATTDGSANRDSSNLVHEASDEVDELLPPIVTTADENEILDSSNLLGDELTPLGPSPLGPAPGTSNSTWSPPAWPQTPGQNTSNWTNSSMPQSAPSWPTAGGTPLGASQQSTTAPRPAKATFNGVLAPVAALDRGLAKLAGEGNKLVHSVFRVSAVLLVVVVLVGLGWIVGGGFRQSADADTQSEAIEPDVPDEVVDQPLPDLPPLPRETTSIGMELVLIPAGEFAMGSPSREPERGGTETLHQIRITKPFYLGVYEVTQQEWGSLMKSNPSRYKRLTEFDVGRFPVEQITWYEAVEFCNALSEKEQLPPYYTIEPGGGRRSNVIVTIAGGNGYRLPTEAEWEYACRAGTRTPFHFGRINNGVEANVNGSVYPYGTQTEGPNLQRPTTVGSYVPNRFGLYDMHGNVSEWCQDWHDPADDVRSPTDDPLGPDSGTLRVVRGGSWDTSPGGSRSAYRTGRAPHLRGAYDGFRVARTAPDSGPNP